MKITEIRKTYDSSVRVKAWWNGKLETVYVRENRVHNAKAYVFRRKADKPEKFRGRIFQNNEGKLYFISNKELAAKAV